MWIKDRIEATRWTVMAAMLFGASVVEGLATAIDLASALVAGSPPVGETTLRLAIWASLAIVGYQGVRTGRVHALSVSLLVLALAAASLIVFR
jgi:hypothetical protein